MESKLSTLLSHEIPFREVETFKRRLILLMRSDFYYKITAIAKQVLAEGFAQVHCENVGSICKCQKRFPTQFLNLFCLQ